MSHLSINSHLFWAMTALLKWCTSDFFSSSFPRAFRKPHFWRHNVMATGKTGAVFEHFCLMLPNLYLSDQFWRKHMLLLCQSLCDCYLLKIWYTHELNRKKRKKQNMIKQNIFNKIINEEALHLRGCQWASNIHPTIFHRFQLCCYFFFFNFLELLKKTKKK